MFCHKCGGQVSEGAAFCARCGSPVVRRHSAAQPQQAKPAQQQSAQRPAQQEQQQARLAQQVAQRPAQQAQQQARPAQPQRAAARPAPAPQVAQPAARPAPTAALGVTDKNYDILRVAEAVVAILLVVGALLLPIMNVGFGDISQDLSAIGVIRGAGQLNQFGFTDAPILIVVMVLLLVVGLASMAACALMCLLRPRFTKVNPTSWGMVLFAVGSFVLVQVVNAAIASALGELGRDLGVNLLHTGIGVWVLLVGGIACGVLDVLRSRKT